MIRGSCLCGAVGYEITAPLEEMHHCHCASCRKVHAAAFSTYAQAPRSAFRFTRGADSVKSFRSSPPCERTFCGECGSNLQFLLEPVPDSVWVAVGTFDDPPDRLPEAHIFVASKAAWHDIADALPQFEGFP